MVSPTYPHPTVALHKLGKPLPCVPRRHCSACSTFLHARVLASLLGYRLFSRKLESFVIVSSIVLPRKDGAVRLCHLLHLDRKSRAVLADLVRDVPGQCLKH